MDVGIGLPNAVRGVDRAGIVDWARRAEDAGFSSLGTIDRIAYPSAESLTALAAAAAVTERIGLLTDILIAPLRTNTALLAKQAATIQAISDGRLTLGLAVGGREDDYTTSGASFAGRGRAFDAQLEELAGRWAAGETGPAGARPGLLIGGANPKTFRRAAAHADGWTMGGGTPDQLAAGAEQVRAAFAEAGRAEEPRLVALCYFGLGDRGPELAREALGDYYAWLGAIADQIVASAVTDADTARGYRDAFAAAGASELIYFPCSPDPAQVGLLAEALA